MTEQNADEITAVLAWFEDELENALTRIGEEAFDRYVEVMTMTTQDVVDAYRDQLHSPAPDADDGEGHRRSPSRRHRVLAHPNIHTPQNRNEMRTA